MAIVLYPNELLSKVSEPVQKFDEDLTKLFSEMEQAMRAEGGIGISAIQIGIPLRAMIVTDQKDGSLIKVVNPEVADDPECPKKLLREGCLSIPGVQAGVWRPEDIEVKFKTETGEDKHSVFYEMEARCFYHEIDHLNGITMFDKLSSIARSATLQRYRNARRKMK